MTIHLFQFRFGATEPFKLCPPPYLVNIGTLFHLRLNLFWVDTPGCTEVAVRDIYRMEFEVFKSLEWCLFYLFAVVVFSIHMCLGWEKAVPAPSLDIPKRYHSKAIHVGYVMTIFIALISASISSIEGRSGLFGSPPDDDSMSRMVSMARLVSSPMALKCLSTPVSGKLPMNTPGVGSGTAF